LERSDGSCQWKQGNTEVLVAVYGPKDVSRKRERIDRSDIKIIVKPNQGLPNVSITRLQDFVEKCFLNNILLSLHPRTQIKIIIQIIADDGSLLSCCLNGTTLALIDAGVPLRSIYTAITLVQREDKELTIDPTKEEENNSISSLTFQINQAGQIISELSEIMPDKLNSEIDMDTYWKAREQAKSFSTKISHFINITITSKCLYENTGSGYQIKS